MNPENNSRRDKERGIFPFFVEFVKFFVAFVVIVAVALLALRVVGAQMR